MLESPATDPGRAAEEMPEALRVELMPEAENLAVALTEAVLADGLGFKGPFEEFGRIAEPLLLDALGAARRDGAQIAIAQLQADLIAARKERDEARRDHDALAQWWKMNPSLIQHRIAAAEAEAAQLRARLHEAEKGKTVDLDTAMKRGIRSWSAKLHIPVTRMMSRVLREEIHAALTPAPEANQEAGDGSL